MRKANEDSPEVRKIIRQTFECPTELADEFRALAKRRERTLSSELRKLMADELRREATWQQQA